jgi:hypothetical protein
MVLRGSGAVRPGQRLTVRDPEHIEDHAARRPRTGRRAASGIRNCFWEMGFRFTPIKGGFSPQG